jgi:hypothetical protein
MDVDALLNHGIVLINDPDRAAEERTIVVLGTARSGTSLAAGVLSHLGVFMGDNARAPVFEDTRLAHHFEEAFAAPNTSKSRTEKTSAGNSGNKPESRSENKSEYRSEHKKKQALDAARATVSEYNNHSVWGWKRPSSINYLQELHRELRNPVYVVSFKDPLAIANRNLVSMGTPLLPNMQQVLKEYTQLLEFLTTTQPPACLYSYDKAMQNQEMFVDMLSTLATTAASDEQVQKALDFMTRDSEAYLLASTVKGVRGHLDLVEPERVTGWALQGEEQRKGQGAGQGKGAAETKVEVEILVNDVVTARIRADRYRNDLKQSGVCKDGLAAFDIAISPPLKSGDVVRARAAGESRDLNGSPRKV